MDRSRLPQPQWSAKEQPPYKSPKNSLEIEIQLVWQAVIHKHKISVDEDFSAIGGTMMHAVIINAVLRWDTAWAC